MRHREFARLRWAEAVVIVALLAPSYASAQNGDAVMVDSPRLTLAAAREASGAMLMKSCSACHGYDRKEGGASRDRFNVDDIDALALDRTLVEPANPDASLLYQVLLSEHRPHAVFGNATSVVPPTVAEIEAVRDWIEQLPETGATCPGRVPISDNDIARLGDEWRKLSGAKGDRLVFISLAHLHNACRTEAYLATVRDSIGPALAVLAGRSEPAPVDTVGELSLLAAVDPEAIGIDAGLITELVRLDPLGAAGGLTADWLIGEAHRRKPSPATGAVAHEYEGDVGLWTAAAEFGEDLGAFTSRLQALEGQDGKTGRRLLQSRLPRAEWLTFMARLKGTPPATVASVSAPDVPVAETLRVSLWSDKLSYKAGELAQFTAVASADCHLTLIGVDKAGSATVLFPNDLDGANLLRAGTSITIPVAGAPYQFRFKEAGQESVVAVCTAPDQRPRGIAHDFERQRFTVLGSWRAFLRAMPEREAAIARQERRTRTERSSSTIPADTPPQEARAAIRIKIE